jgi:hypothetical protein
MTLTPGWQMTGVNMVFLPFLKLLRKGAGQSLDLLMNEEVPF